MRTSYDAESDALYIYVIDDGRPVARTIEVVPARVMRDVASMHSCATAAPAV